MVKLQSLELMASKKIFMIFYFFYTYQFKIYKPEDAQTSKKFC